MSIFLITRRRYYFIFAALSTYILVWFFLFNTPNKLKPSTPTAVKLTKTIFLDHGGRYYHAEVFYSVANLVINLYPESYCRFIVDQRFGERTGLKEFWDTYAKEGPIENFSYNFVEIENYRPLHDQYTNKREVCNPDNITTYFDLRVVVTTPRLNISIFCLTDYVENPKYLFILHHPEYLERDMVKYSNAYIASNSLIARQLSPRTFSPDLFPIQQKPPNCNLPPVFIAQGDISSRRYVTELFWLLNLDQGNLNITIRILTKADKPSFLLNDPRVEYYQNLNMTLFHEKFIHSSFLLLLISPNYRTTKSYLSGHPSSNIAYGKTFNLQFIGHQDVYSAYRTELSITDGYWYDGTHDDFERIIGEALGNFTHNCALASALASVNDQMQEYYKLQHNEFHKILDVINHKPFARNEVLFMLGVGVLIVLVLFAFTWSF